MIVQLTTFSNVILDVALARNGFVTEMRIVWMEKLANFYHQMNEIVLLIALRTSSNVWMVIVFQKIGNVMVSNFLNPLILWIKKNMLFHEKRRYRRLVFDFTEKNCFFRPNRLWWWIGRISFMPHSSMRGRSRIQMQQFWKMYSKILGLWWSQRLRRSRIGWKSRSLSGTKSMSTRRISMFESSVHFSNSESELRIIR